MMGKAEKAKLNNLYKKLQIKSKTFLGYPANNKFDYSELFKFLNFHINNVGDPFSRLNFQTNTKEIEIEVLRFFAKLFHLKNKDFWGYVTNGGTEGNMYGLYLARETLPKGLIYFSQDIHYSISKIVRVLDMKSVVVSSLENGEINYGQLEKAMKKNRKYPVIICANIGTTMKGAVDDIKKIVKILKRQRIRNYYIHCDAALFGMILPFVKKPPLFDFRASISSIAVSGHKMIGSPVSCGVVLAKKGLVKKTEKPVEYLGVSDTTISGSRSGFNSLILWCAIKKYGIKGFKAMVSACFKNAEYALTKLEEIGWQGWRNKNSLIVVIKKPSEKIIKKWQLASAGKLAHLIILPQHNRKIIDRLIKDLKKI